MAKAKITASTLYRSKPKKKRPGVHSKNNKPEKAYKGQGRL
jgi:hypothetical protein